MPKINVLDKHVAELIAAGEVVERPCSVIKELVENAVDAGAASVTVEIKNGGVTLMRVTDNGCGIAREDVPTAFLRHATSKVRTENDLDGIGTLGFRGEALASIAAVARVELLTRPPEDLAGTRYAVEGGEELACEDAGCAPGTTILIRDIFYNVPARMKFLKKDVTEANAIAGVLDKLALSHPEVAFRFLRDGKETLRTPGDGKLKSAIYAVFGKEFTDGLIPVEYAYQGVRVWGFVSKPACARPNRSMQQFFINGRYIKSRTAGAALEEAFKGSIMVGKLPACVLHMELNFAAVDVNVHPAKIEVRFVNEKPIFDAVYHGVKTALNQGDTPHVYQMKPPVLPQPPAPVQIKLDTMPGAQGLPPREKTLVPSKPSIHPGHAAPLAVQFSATSEDEPDVSVPNLARPSVQVSQARPVSSLRDSSVAVVRPFAEAPKLPVFLVTEPVPEGPVLDVAPKSQEQPNPEAIPTPARLVGEAFGTYILMERGDELVMIDKHAAHERMLYERLKAARGDADLQLLLQPVAVTLDKSEYSAVLDNLELFQQAGFEMEDFGSGTVLVRSAPMILGGEDIAGAVMEMAGALLSCKSDLTTEKLDWLYHNVACRAAVKAGDESSPQELMDLVRKLDENPDIRYCPHGRPVSIVMKKRDLEKQFGRA